MKKLIPFLLVSLMICPGLRAQVLSHFTWDTSSDPKIAFVGPNAISAGTGAEAQPSGNAGSVNGLAPGVTILGPFTQKHDIDLKLFNNAMASLSQPDIEFVIDYRHDQPESIGYFFSSDANASGPEFVFGFEFRKLTLRFTWDDGSVNGKAESFTLLNYWPGDPIPTGSWHTYSFAYEGTLGQATLRVDGLPVWSIATAINANMRWSTNPLYLGHEVDNLGVDATVFDNVIIQSPEPLPVEWGTFEGVQAQRGVRLDWETYSQLNFNYFEVEYAPDGRAFRPIGRVSGPVSTQEAQQYSFMHEQPQTGANYYRLRQVDLDGSVHYSRRIEVNFALDAASPLSFYPNPVSERLSIGLNETPGEATRLDVGIYDLSGRLLRQSKLDIAAQQRETHLDTEGIAPGAYLVKVNWQGRTVYHKMTK